MANLFLIKKSWITEKAAREAPLGKYVFSVEKNATKSEIKKAIKEMYKVDAVKVNVLNRVRKQKGFQRVKGYQQGIKKAVVTLKKGQTIDVQ